MGLRSMSCISENQLRRYSTLIIFLIGLLCVFNVVAQSNSHRIDHIKAAFILNIVRFVSWPDHDSGSSDGHLMLCLYRENSINSAIAHIHGKKAGGRSIEINQIESLAESRLCHVLILSEQPFEKFVDDIQPGLDRPMLTIADFTEVEGFLHMHPDILISLVRNGPRIGFQINLNKTREVGLRMSSKLLKLATIVGEES